MKEIVFLVGIKIGMMNNKESGQTLVEYLLLTLVIVTVLYNVFRSDVFRNMVDLDGDVMDGFIRQMRYSYRHALPGKERPVINYGSIDHDSYYDKKNQETRFFAPNAPYPR